MAELSTGTAGLVWCVVDASETISSCEERGAEMNEVGGFFSGLLATVGGWMAPAGGARREAAVLEETTGPLGEEGVVSLCKPLCV